MKYFNISINDLQISESQGEKVLGVFVEATFSWTCRINHIIKKLNSSLAVICRNNKI
jgi:hypothetical protein